MPFYISLDTLLEYLNNNIPQINSLKISIKGTFKISHKMSQILRIFYLYFPIEKLFCQIVTIFLATI
jgi:hypothetical protein